MSTTFPRLEDIDACLSPQLPPGQRAHALIITIPYKTRKEKRKTAVYLLT